MRKIYVLLTILLATTCVFAEGTRTWQQSSFEEFEKGTAKGIAIRSDGILELAPSFKAVTTTQSTYIWALASDSQGNIYAAAGSPARVYLISPDGQTSVIFEPTELQVQSLVVDSAGAIYAATSPDGKVYKLQRRAPDNKLVKPGTLQPVPPQTPVSATDNGGATPDPNWISSVYFEPKTKYIWALALAKDGSLYVATGDRGEIFRVDRAGQGSLFFKSDEAHIRSLALDSQGNLIAGSDGSGLVYRISPQGEAFVLYSAPKKEITALTIDRAGNIYAAAVGEKRVGGAPSVPTPGTLAMPIALQPRTSAHTRPRSAASRRRRDRLRGLPDRSRRLSEAPLGLARRRGVRTCPRPTWTFAGGHREQGQGVFDH
jgi:sugar lactone lactonase YvrE